MNESIYRVGNFTSSNIYKLCSRDKKGKSLGAPALTYIKEKQAEIRLGRSLDTGSYSRPMAWGNFVEQWYFDNELGFEFKIFSKQTFAHPTIENWTGSPDFTSNEVIAELKCYEPKNFSSYADALLTKDTEIIKKEHPKEYWQLISNAIILNKPLCEAILFMPNEEQLENIAHAAECYEGGNAWEYRFIYEEFRKNKWNLPFLPSNSVYEPCVRFKFEPPKQDIEYLTNSVEMAKGLLLTNVSNN